MNPVSKNVWGRPLQPDKPKQKHKKKPKPKKHQKKAPSPCDQFHWIRAEHRDLLAKFWGAVPEDDVNVRIHPRVKDYSCEVRKKRKELFVNGSGRMSLLVLWSGVRINRPDFTDEKMREHFVEQFKGVAWKKYPCWCCRKDPATVRHHIIQIQHGGRNTPENIVVLCDKCHESIHPWLKRPDMATIRLDDSINSHMQSIAHEMIA
jgi:hypothetical protein